MIVIVIVVVAVVARGLPHRPAARSVAANSSQTGPA
jgi:hypothetical protein